MPRDGSGIYHRPPGTDAVTDTSIESTKYNINVADVEQDLNAPRPIIAGGTGANNAHDAMIALNGEIAGQVVDNYDTFPFVSGSFYSAPGATNSPVPNNWFLGTAVVTGASVIIQTRVLGTSIQGTLYLREKYNGTWGAWGTIASPNDKVSKSGDIMTGNLIMASPAIITTGSKGHLFGVPSGASIGTPITSSLDASIKLYDGGPSNWCGMGCDQNGNYWVRVGLTGFPTAALSINAQNGLVNVAGGITAGAAINAGGAVNANADCRITRGGSTVGTLFLGSGSSYLIYDGSSFTLTGGPLYVSGVNASGNVGAPSVSATGNMSADTVTTNGSITAGGPITGTSLAAQSGGISAAGAITTPANVVSTNGIVQSSGGRLLSLGNQASVTVFNQPTNNAWGFWGNGSGWMSIGGMYGNGDPFSEMMRLGAGAFEVLAGIPAYKNGGGPWLDNSDARIKNIVGDYDNGLDAIKTLRPVVYTFKGNDTPAEVQPSNMAIPDPKDPKSKEAAVVPYANSSHHSPAKSGKEFVGLIAQECEVAFPEMVREVDGTIDGKPVNDMRELDTAPLVFALINAVKTLAARVEELEARQPAR